MAARDSRYRVNRATDLQQMIMGGKPEGPETP